MPGASLATASRDSGSSSLRFRRTCIALCSFHDGLTSLRLEPPPGQPTTAGGLPSHIPTIESAPLPGTKERGRGVQETSISVPKTRLPPPDTTRGSWTTYFVPLRHRPAPLRHRPPPPWPVGISIWFAERVTHSAIGKRFCKHRQRLPMLALPDCRVYSCQGRAAIPSKCHPSAAWRIGRRRPKIRPSWNASRNSVADTRRHEPDCSARAKAASAAPDPAPDPAPVAMTTK